MAFMMSILRTVPQLASEKHFSTPRVRLILVGCLVGVTDQHIWRSPACRPLAVALEVACRNDVVVLRQYLYKQIAIHAATSNM